MPVPTNASLIPPIGTLAVKGDDCVVCQTRPQSISPSYHHLHTVILHSTSQYIAPGHRQFSPLSPGPHEGFPKQAINSPELASYLNYRPSPRPAHTPAPFRLAPPTICGQPSSPPHNLLTSNHNLAPWLLRSPTTKFRATHRRMLATSNHHIHHTYMQAGIYVRL